jgi:hypothetical protein
MVIIMLVQLTGRTIDNHSTKLGIIAANRNNDLG